MKDVEDLFQDLPIEERFSKLAKSSDYTESDFEYEKVLTEDEIQERYKELWTHDKFINEVSAEKKRVVKDFTERLAGPTRRRNELIEVIRTGEETITATVFEFKDIENDRVNIFGQDGKYIRSRDIRDSEKQFDINYNSDEVDDIPV